jgi:hypothetical protein
MSFWIEICALTKVPLVWVSGVVASFSESWFKVHVEDFMLALWLLPLA